MLPPKCKGRVIKLSPAGKHTINDNILTLEFDGKKTEYTMAHWWPVR